MPAQSVDKNDTSKKSCIEWLVQMFETSHKHRKKIAIGGFYSKTGVSRYLKLRKEILLKNWTEQIFEISPGFIIVKLV